MGISAEERNAIFQMTEEELVKYIASLDSEMELVYNNFVEGEKQATSEKRKRMVKVVEQIIFREDKPNDTPTAPQDQDDK